MMSAQNPLIMVVEDDAMLLLGYEMAIEDVGMRHVTATTLQEGLDALTPDIDVAILDIRLGTDRVFELAHEILRCGIPFLFCSGTADDMPRGAFSQAPMMHKPVGADKVVARAVGIMRKHDESA